MKKLPLVEIGIISLTAVLMVLGFLRLPDSVAIQWNRQGEVSNYLPKLALLALAAGLCAFGLFWRSGKDRKGYLGIERILYEVLDTLMGSLGAIILLIALVTN